MVTYRIRPKEQCFFNEIELMCPYCKTKQMYLDVTICGQDTVVCDYCTKDIKILIGKGDKAFRRINHQSIKDGTQITVISRR